MQGHIAISAHTVGTVVVIDEAGPKLRAFSTDHLGQQVSKNSLIAFGFSLTTANLQPPPRKAPNQKWAFRLSAAPTLALPLPPNTHMPTGLAVVSAFGDGIEGLLAAHAHGDFLFPDRRRCPLPEVHILGGGLGPRSETAPQPRSATAPWLESSQGWGAHIYTEGLALPHHTYWRQVILLSGVQSLQPYQQKTAFRGLQYLCSPYFLRRKDHLKGR